VTSYGRGRTSTRRRIGQPHCRGTPACRGSTRARCPSPFPCASGRPSRCAETDTTMSSVAAHRARASLARRAKRKGGRAGVLRRECRDWIEAERGPLLLQFVPEHVSTCIVTWAIAAWSRTGQRPRRRCSIIEVWRPGGSHGHERGRPRCHSQRDPLRGIARGRVIKVRPNLNRQCYHDRLPSQPIPNNGDKHEAVLCSLGANE